MKKADVEKNPIGKGIDHEQNILASFKNALMFGKTKSNAVTVKEILVLEQKRKDLKNKMTDYRADKREDWASFKTEFSNDLDELGLALKNFAIDN